MNPDGFERAREGECEGQDLKSGRTNSKGKDLNRNFPTWDDLVNTELQVGPLIWDGFLTPKTLMPKIKGNNAKMTH